MILACVAVSIDLRAQYNDSVHYRVAAILGGNINNTNSTETMLFNNGIQLGIRKKTFELNNTNNWTYGTQNNMLTNNDVISTFDFNRYFRIPHFNYWGLGNYTSSFSLKINNQYQLGAGLAYSIIDKKDFRVKVSDGLVWESSDITLPDSTNELYSTWRNSLRLTIRGTIGSIFTFSGSGFWQPSLSNSADYILRSDITASVKLQKWLSITLAYNFNRFSRTQKENALFTYGITIENYFR